MSDHYHEAEDILVDESFLSWYFNTGDGKDRAWVQWMNEHPEREEEVMQAVQLLEAARLDEQPVTREQLEQALKRLMSGVDELESANAAPARADIGLTDAPGREKNVRRLVRFRWAAVAAAILCVVGALWLIRSGNTGAKPEMATTFGQLVNQQLPDGTEVTMNANSRLSYETGWADGKDREVWVTGEAFFHVRKTARQSRFIVHSDHFDIIVTGTRFNVVNRHGKDNVLLQEGSVILQMKDGRTMQMRPGDFVAYDSTAMATKPVRTDSALAWKDQKLVLDHTPLHTLAVIIQDHYGVSLRMADDSTGDRAISAILPNNNLEVLLQALEATGDFSIVRQGQDILIKARKQE